MIHYNYQVGSRLGRKSFYFPDKDSAVNFFKKFIGNAILIINGHIVDEKRTITDTPTLVHASIFLQHGITKEGSNHIRDRFMSPPSDDVIKDFMRAQELFCTPGKGLLLIGTPGTGKTTIMRYLQDAAEAGYLGEVNTFEKVSVTNIIRSFKNSGTDLFEQFKLRTEDYLDICIDDLGEDNGMRMLYGDKVNILADIIKYRYDCYTEKGLLTHFTSNCSPEELQHLYDKADRPVIYGRIMEMTTFMVLEGRDWRFFPLQ